MAARGQSRLLILNVTEEKATEALIPLEATVEIETQAKENVEDNKSLDLKAC